MRPNCPASLLHHPSGVPTRPAASLLQGLLLLLLPAICLFRSQFPSPLPLFIRTTLFRPFAFISSSTLCLTNAANSISTISHTKNCRVYNKPPTNVTWQLFHPGQASLFLHRNLPPSAAAVLDTRTPKLPIALRSHSPSTSHPILRSHVELLPRCSPAIHAKLTFHDAVIQSPWPSSPKPTHVFYTAEQ